MKKQSDSVKGKRRDDGFLLPPASRGTRRSCSRSRKRQTRRRRNPSSFVASSSPTMLAFPSLVLTVAAGSFCASFPSGSLSTPGPLLGMRELPLPSVFYSCGAHPKVLKVAL
ncbi:hypothetical protein P7K49_040031 [Saguinus oedipus]|uniref:Uncharacterized protein n=1 Tax=Saguinus oedipus TaxID=9490 RepID=A0ABQ9TDE8_SAGOE|nr:hypothetical protein P7K49_040031 [Saguinus oedipus]